MRRPERDGRSSLMLLLLLLTQPFSCEAGGQRRSLCVVGVEVWTLAHVFQ